MEVDLKFDSLVSSKHVFGRVDDPANVLLIKSKDQVQLRSVSDGVHYLDGRPVLIGSVVPLFIAQVQLIVSFKVLNKPLLIPVDSTLVGLNTVNLILLVVHKLLIEIGHQDRVQSLVVGYLAENRRRVAEFGQQLIGLAPHLGYPFGNLLLLDPIEGQTTYLSGKLDSSSVGQDLSQFLVLCVS